jgi:Outer membrane protein beta-barrel domain
MSRSVVCLLKSSRYLPALFLGFAVAASTAFAQSTSSTQYSSSTADSLDEGLSTLSYHAPASGQNTGGYGQGGYHQYSGEPGFHHIAIEAGAGFDAPLGNTKAAQTFGWNIKLGGGWNFNQHLGVLLEYEFNRTGIPDNVLATVAQQAGVGVNGNVHVWGFTLDPIYYYKTTGSWGGYITGGGGFYRKVTTFSTPIFLGFGCDFFYGCFPQYSNQTISHFSSNQGGVSIGTGLTHNIGNGAKLFAEARYLWVDSPPATATKLGSGTVSMIPVTFGIRF